MLSFVNAQIGESPKKAQVLVIVFEYILGLDVVALSKFHYCCDDKELQ